ncbi:hypothetical protein [Blastococcus saxobsidens]|nr:hypothetical protein [Blastococcus saxobsidens]
MADVDVGMTHRRERKVAERQRCCMIVQALPVDDAVPPAGAGELIEVLAA